MGWTYNGPSASDKDAVRFNIGDTDKADPQLSNEEIEYLLVQRPNVLLASADACDHLAAKYSRQVSKSLGAVSVQAGDRSKAYAELAITLRKRRTRQGCVPKVGGMSRDEKRNARLDPDVIQPNFVIGQDDQPSTNTDPIAPWIVGTGSSS